MWAIHFLVVRPSFSKSPEHTHTSPYSDWITRHGKRTRKLLEGSSSAESCATVTDSNGWLPADLSPDVGEIRWLVIDKHPMSHKNMPIIFNKAHPHI